jgi:hypothetical protein
MQYQTRLNGVPAKVWEVQSHLSSLRGHNTKFSDNLSNYLLVVIDKKW